MTLRSTCERVMMGKRVKEPRGRMPAKAVHPHPGSFFFLDPTQYRHTVRGSAQRNSLGPGANMDKSGCVYRRSIAKCRAPCAGSWPAQAEYCWTGNRKTSLRTGIPAAFHACGHRGLKYKNQELRGAINCSKRISR